jgi:hypothetical protein
MTGVQRQICLSAERPIFNDADAKESVCCMLLLAKTTLEFSVCDQLSVNGCDC